jgi:lipoprotein-anchoring transpeptidase ErfK/SrfK
MIRLGPLAVFAIATLALSDLGHAQTAASGTRFFDPVTRAWVEFDQRGDGKSQRNPVPRQVVDYDGSEAAGTIIVDTSERRLYFVLGDGTAIKYGVGVGREGFQWSGRHKVTRKQEWPGWTPPPAMRKRQPHLPAHMAGGPNNPLGARALYIGSTLYRIHGSNEPWSIGQAVSSGCIRMANEDVMHLYDQVKVGTRVIVRN